MKGKKGQALVEFVIIMPIFMMMILGTIDMGKIFYTKIILEGQISDVISWYQDGKSEGEINNKLKQDEMLLEIKEDSEYATFNLVKKVDIITPGLNLIFDNPYNLEVSRSINNDS